jgi:hypothetical protein
VAVGLELPAYLVEYATASRLTAQRSNADDSPHRSTLRISARQLLDGAVLK